VSRNKTKEKAILALLAFLLATLPARSEDRVLAKSNMADPARIEAQMQFYRRLGYAPAVDQCSSAAVAMCKRVEARGN